MVHYDFSAEMMEKHGDILSPLVKKEQESNQISEQFHVKVKAWKQYIENNLSSDVTWNDMLDAVYSTLDEEFPELDWRREVDYWATVEEHADDLAGVGDVLNVVQYPTNGDVWYAHVVQQDLFSQSVERLGLEDSLAMQHIHTLADEDIMWLVEMSSHSVEHIIDTAENAEEYLESEVEDAIKYIDELIDGLANLMDEVDVKLEECRVDLEAFIYDELCGRVQSNIEQDIRNLILEYQESGL